MKLVILPEAAGDLVDGFWFYDRNYGNYGNYEPVPGGSVALPA